MQTKFDTLLADLTFSLSPRNLMMVWLSGDGGRGWGVGGWQDVPMQTKFNT